MRISITEAKRQLADLIRCAEAGDEVILTRHGRATLRLVAIHPVAHIPSREVLLAAVRASAAAKAIVGAAAARSQDFLYDGNGLPE